MQICKINSYIQERQCRNVITCLLSEAKNGDIKMIIQNNFVFHGTYYESSYHSRMNDIIAKEQWTRFQTSQV